MGVLQPRPRFTRRHDTPSPNMSLVPMDPANKWQSSPSRRLVSTPPPPTRCKSSRRASVRVVHGIAQRTCPTGAGQAPPLLNPLGPSTAPSTQAPGGRGCGAGRAHTPRSLSTRKPPKRGAWHNDTRFRCRSSAADVARVGRLSTGPRHRTAAPPPPCSPGAWHGARRAPASSSRRGGSGAPSRGCWCCPGTTARTFAGRWGCTSGPPRAGTARAAACPAGARWRPGHTG